MFDGVHERIEAMQTAATALGIYLSVPFCRAKCTFCNFASGVGSPEAIERYVDLLCAEIAGLRSEVTARGGVLPRVVDSLYFGGGTPSLLEPAQLQRVFAALRGEFAMVDEMEVTLEAAPGQIGAAVLEAGLAMGVNRVSLGVQSFADREAQAVGRSHTEASCLAEFARLQKAGVTNIGADLIAGLPYQTEASWAHSLAVAAGCGLDHLSVYMLEVDDDSRLGREVLGGGARLHAPAVPSDDLVAALYAEACTTLPAAGFAQYEISNFAVPGRASRHNFKYWTREPYVGFGLDAHSMLFTEDGQALRWANAEELTGYDGLPQIRSAARVSEREAFEETVFLGLRLAAGLPRERLALFPRMWREDFEERATMLCHEGLLAKSVDEWRLTGHGRAVSNEVMGELLVGVAA